MQTVKDMTHQTANNIGRNSLIPDKYPILAMANGMVTQVEQLRNGDYRFVTEYSCNVYSIFIHVDKISDKILSQTGLRVNDPTHQYVQVNVNVKKGEQIASVNSHTFDFSLHDNSVTLKNFVYPEHYEGEY